jgi:hypothetical protein
MSRAAAAIEQPATPSQSAAELRNESGWIAEGGFQPVYPAAYFPIPTE